MGKFKLYVQTLWQIVKLGLLKTAINMTDIIYYYMLIDKYSSVIQLEKLFFMFSSLY